MTPRVQQQPLYGFPVAGVRAMCARPAPRVDVYTGHRRIYHRDTTTYCAAANTAPTGGGS